MYSKEQYEKAVEIWWSIVGVEEKKVMKDSTVYSAGNLELEIKHTENKPQPFLYKRKLLYYSGGSHSYDRVLITGVINTDTPEKLLRTLLDQFRSNWVFEYRGTAIDGLKNKIETWGRHYKASGPKCTSVQNSVQYSAAIGNADVKINARLYYPPENRDTLMLDATMETTMGKKVKTDKFDDEYKFLEFIYVHFHPDFQSIQSDVTVDAQAELWHCIRRLTSLVERHISSRSLGAASI